MEYEDEVAKIFELTEAEKKAEGSVSWLAEAVRESGWDKDLSLPEAGEGGVKYKGRR